MEPTHADRGRRDGFGAIVEELVEVPLCDSQPLRGSVCIAGSLGFAVAFDGSLDVGTQVLTVTQVLGAVRFLQVARGR
jgi:hypothetical protein